MPSLALPSSQPAVAAYRGSVDLTLALRDGVTRLTHSRARPPLLVQRALYPDPTLPQLAYILLANPTGGIFQGDHHRIDISAGPGALAHVTTQGATRAYTMPHGQARQEVNLRVAAGAHLEYLPDPLIPYRDASLEQVTAITVEPAGSLLFWDIIAPGRVAMGESCAYRRLFNQVEVGKDSGPPGYRDVFQLEPTRRNPLGGSLLNRAFPGAESVVFGTMLIVCDGPGLEQLLAGLREALASEPAVAAGATTLPNNLGLGIRALGPDTATVHQCLKGCWSLARQHILGAPAPTVRKY